MINSVSVLVFPITTNIWGAEYEEKSNLDGRVYRRFCVLVVCVADALG